MERTRETDKYMQEFSQFFGRWIAVLLLLMLVAFFAGCGSSSASTNSPAAATTPGDSLPIDPAAKPCADNYRRIAPNFCQIIKSFSTWYPPSSTTCTALEFTQPLPPEAKEALVTLEWFVTANGVVGLHGNDIGFYSDSNCQNHTHSSGFWAYEFYPLTPGTVIGHKDSEMRLPLVSQNRVYYNTGNDGSFGNAHMNGIDMIGYFD